jgi:demethoxyubiquinone hydroxylase (CLK1/Coq7/Cat5 family)
MQITTLELDWLNFYRASELHGGLVLGQLVRRVRDPELILCLTRHSAEEVMHAQLWTETILEVGGRPAQVRQTYQHLLAKRVGAPGSVFRVLALTQVFERRVYRHFIDHERRPGTHPVVRQTLRRMVEEEKDHLSWVKEWLDVEGAKRGIDVPHFLSAYEAIDDAVYAQVMAYYRFAEAA